MMERAGWSLIRCFQLWSQTGNKAH